MRSRTLQTHFLVLVVLALMAMTTGKAGADPATRDKWVSDDGKTVIFKFPNKEGWFIEWENPAKKTAGITGLKLIKTTDAEKVFEQETGKDTIKVTLGAKEAVIETEKATGPVPGKLKGSWK